MTITKKIKDKYLYIPIIILLFFFIYEIILYYQIVSLYPIRVVGDVNTYMMKVHLLANYGFHNLVPFTYNGILTLRAYPPGWAFFTLPFLLIIKDTLLANFISLLSIFILSLIAIYIICKKEKNSKIKALAFFLLLFANPFLLDSILHIGRSSIAFAWMVFLWFFALINYYKNKDIDLKFIILFTIAYTILILTHIYLLIIGSIITFSFLLTKLDKNYIKTIISLAIPAIIGLIITSFWWIPFSKAMSVKEQLWSIEVEATGNVIGSFFSYNTVSIIIFLGVILFYLINQKPKDKFTYPLITLALLIITRLIIFIPILKELPFNIYTTFFIFLSIFYFFKIDFSIIKKSHRKIIYIILILLPFIFGIILFGKYYDFTMEYRPPEFRNNPELDGISAYEQTDLDKDVFSILKETNNKFIILNHSSQRKLYNTYSVYSIIKHNKQPILGTHPWDALDQSVIGKLDNLYASFDNKDCKDIINISKDLEIKEIISLNDGCKLLKQCNLKLQTENERACLFNI